MSAEREARVGRREQGHLQKGGRGDLQRRNLDLADELYAPDYVLHDPSLPEDLRGPEGLNQYAAMSRRAFPDARVTVEDQIAEGDKVVDRWTATGTHTCDLMGVPPTGRRIEVSGITIGRFAGERSWRSGTRATTSG